MKKKNYVIVFFLSIVIWACSPFVKVPDENDNLITVHLDTGAPKLIYPAVLLQKKAVPVFVSNSDFVGEGGIYWGGSQMGVIKKGFGVFFLPNLKERDNSIWYQKSELPVLTRLKKNVDHVISSAFWPDSLNFISNKLIHIRNDVVVPKLMDLVFLEGNTFLIDSSVNIYVKGSLTSVGKEKKLNSFLALDTLNAWGGIIATGNIDVQHTLFMNGGGSQEPKFWRGHSNSQATLHIESSSGNIHHSYFVHNVGKGVFSYDSKINITNSTFSFCDMGGEFHKSHVNVKNSRFQFFPDDSENYVDDDNDATYFFGTYGKESDSIYSHISNSYFFHGKDDAIDHNGAFLSIENSWVENFTHEGVAASSKHQVIVENSVFKNCNNGIEAGYGNPKVLISHCVFSNNDVGVKYGDNYNWGSDGTIEIFASIFSENIESTKNYDILFGGAKLDSMTCQESLFDTEMNLCEQSYFNLFLPLNENMSLLDTTIGEKGISSDGKQKGLVQQKVPFK